MKQLLSFILLALYVLIASPISFIYACLLRLPFGRKEVYELEVQTRMIALADFFRVYGEAALLSQPIFFITKDDDHPKYVYFQKREIKKIPESSRVARLPIVRDDGELDMPEARTARIKFSVRKTIFGSYSPGKILHVELLDEAPVGTK